jgi:DNA polymerase I-like protein with 3'-5' exonuclease and polymerase domains
MRDAGWLQMPMFAPAVTWQAPNVATLPRWRDAKRVAIDVETRDDTLAALGPGVRRGFYVCGVSFAIEDGPSAYLPIRHEGDGNLDPAAVESYLRDQARDFTGTIVGSNLQYDLDYLWESSIEFKGAVRHADVQIAEGLLDELQDEYNLDAILKRWGLPGKDESELQAFADAFGVDAKKEMWRLPPGAVGRYAERDVTGPLELLRRQEKELDAQQLGGPWAMECEVLLALLRMTRRGIRVDRGQLESISAWSRTVITEEMARIKHLTGIACESPMNARELEPALAARGFVLPRNHKTDKTTGQLVDNGPSLTKEFLLAHAGEEVVDAIAKARAFHKLDTTYCDGVRRHLVRGEWLHPTFKQMRGASDDDDSDDEGARFGRTASRHTNIQASPVRNKLYGKKWRAIFRPRDGEGWFKGDYSQQEPRTTVHYAEICGPQLGLEAFRGAKKFADAYRNDPMTDSHTMAAAITGLPRGDAKEVFLAVCYGMGGGTFARKLKLPTEMKRKRDGTPYEGAGPAAQAMLDTFDERMPFVRRLARLCTQTAEQRGFLLLVDGRRVRFPKDAHGNYDWTYKALNRLVQGSAAIQSKNALVLLDRANLGPILTVHDDFNFSLTRDDVGRRRALEAREIMMTALPLNVPAKVDFDEGDNYGELSPMEQLAA